jgi:hypothetical protein
MSKVTLNTVKYYDPADIYSFEVDNRPLYDISGNVDLINTAIANLGFYQEVMANPETEPAGGFSALSCVLYGQNGLLFPIDISQPATSIDYAKFPIYLVIEVMGSSKYKCLAFSSAFSLPGLFNKFLPDSIGKAIKVGPGGSLVDEIYFDLYYSDYNYQQLTVGKVLTPTTIAFGGNQVSVLGDNRFLAKNRDDISTGTITKIIQNDVNSTIFKSILTNTSQSSYTFSEFVNQVAAPIGGTPGRTPVYFTSLPLTNTNGVFNTNFLDSVLNEVHFASPSVSAATQLDQKYKTAGINVGSLLGFAQSFLLHAKPLSANLSELSQELSTSLHFDSSVNTGLTTLFDSTLVDFGISAANFPSILRTAASSASGVSLGQFKSEGIGGFLYHLTNNSPADVVYNDVDTQFPMAGLRNGSITVLSSQSSTTGNSALALLSNGPILLDSATGVYCVSPGSEPSSLTNKYYVDKMVTAAANSANSRIPLVGNNSDNAITGSLYWDLTSNEDPSTIFQFNTLVTATVKTAYPIEVKTLATTDFQVVRALTPSSGEDTDLTNRLFVQNKIDAAIGSAIGTNFVSRIAPDTIVAAKTFSDTAQIITNSATPLVLNAPIGLDTVEVASTADVIKFSPAIGGAKVKLETSATEVTDSDTTLVTKKYMLDTVDEIASGKVGEAIYGIWHVGNRTTTISTVSALSGWGHATRGITPDQASSNFLLTFDIVEGGALQYKLNTPAVFTVNVSDARIAGVGQSFPGGIYRTQTVIATNSGGIFQIIARNIHQDDTDGNSINSLVGASCSAIVVLNKDDILYIASEQADTVSASLARIR